MIVDDFKQFNQMSKQSFNYERVNILRLLNVPQIKADIILLIMSIALLFICV